MSNRRRTRNAAPRPVEKPSLIEHLVIIRESGPYAELLMLGMIQQTLTKVQHLPGSQELLSAGLEVFNERNTLGAITKRVGTSRMAMVERDGVLFVYSLGTAAKNDLIDGNAFVVELVRILEHYRPQETWVSSVTRLLRSANYMSELLQALAENTKVLNCEINIRINTTEGRMQFQMLAMFAASERDYILRRHTIGRVSQFQRDEWIPSSHPIGYVKRDRKLVIDENALDTTRQMLTLLADRSLTTVECARRIGALGITTARITKLHGDDATIADVRNYSDVISTILGWIGAYATGEYELIWPNPFPGVTEFAGVPVEFLDGYEYGALRLTQRLPLPEGGWVDDATIASIRLRAATPSLTGGSSHNTAPPLSGLFGFSDEDSEYAIGAGNGTYTLLRRPKVTTRVFQGWHSDTENDVVKVATVSRKLWHTSIANAVLIAIEKGLPAELDRQRFQVTGPLPALNASRVAMRTVGQQLKDAIKSLERAKRNARLAEGDDVAADFIDDVKRFNADVIRLQLELDRLEANQIESEISQTFESNAELVAFAIAALANAEDSTDAVLRNSLRAVISDENWRIEEEMLEWELFVELPHDHGTVKLGPVTGKVPCKLTRSRPPAKRAKSAAATRDELMELGLGERAARCAAACANPTLVGVLFAHLSSRDLPDDVEPDWATHVIEVYTDAEFEWSPDKWRLPNEIRRKALSALNEAGRPLTGGEFHSKGITANQLRHLSRITDAPSGDPILRRVSSQRNAPFTLLDCPHCGESAAWSVVTPETRPGVLCAACRRTPVLGSPKFPDWYLT